MESGTRKTKVEFSNELSTWKGFIEWLREEEDESVIKACIIYEIKHQNRPQFIDRARTRYNKVRAIRELKELEQLSGKKINVAY